MEIRIDAMDEQMSEYMANVAYEALGDPFVLQNMVSYDPVADLAEEMLLSEKCRYIKRPEKYHVHTSDICAKLDGFSPLKCMAILRMQWDSFKKLVDLIWDHDVFKNNSTKPQEEIAGQLTITLHWLGHYGSGVEPILLGEFWDRSPGACNDYVKRCIEAILSLGGQYGAWLSVPE
ncbi:hypothetical protein CPC16_004968 [Podila verticillata]|nr:hypothetical protein CPC16_004968 [Podila verticillata]